ncbi:MAG: hypothetical protein II870_07160 [Synergistaceae bacterium]|nr:hypothetical protein [Synergistaceae bacterium]MBQ6740118.1 hypothetical protein [Synergistaceae bacterium]MBQ9896590.1 hypothetical protein [Synergistaceae bacterium]
MRIKFKAKNLMEVLVNNMADIANSINSLMNSGRFDGASRQRCVTPCIN